MGGPALRTSLGPVVNKDDLLAELCARTGLSRRRAERVVQAVFSGMARRLQVGERVEVRGFGNFVVRASRAHAGSHPRTGTSRAVPAQRCVLFRPSKGLRAALAGDAAVTDSDGNELA